jgi:hypothetical protein
MLLKSLSEALNINSQKCYFPSVQRVKEPKEIGSLRKAVSDEVKCHKGSTAVFGNKTVEVYRVHSTRAFGKRQQH